MNGDNYVVKESICIDGCFSIIRVHQWQKALHHNVDIIAFLPLDFQLFNKLIYQCKKILAK